MNIPDNNREAACVYFPGTNEEEGSNYRVGDVFRKFNTDLRRWEPYKHITSVRVSCDLPGLHCDMFQVTVWAEDELLLQAPFHSVQYVEYK